MSLFFSNNNPLLQFRTIETAHILSMYDNRSAVAFSSAVNADILINKSCAPGFSCYIVQVGAGKATIVADAGVTIISLNSKVQTSGPGDMIAIFSPAPGFFVLQVTNDAGGGGTASNPKKYRGVNFVDATNITDAWLVGKTLAVFYNDIPRYLNDDEFNVTGAGLKILIPDFDGPATDPTLYVTEISAPSGGGGGGGLT